MAASTVTESPVLAPVAWSELRYKARKWTLTATAEVSLATEGVVEPPGYAGEPPVERAGGNSPQTRQLYRLDIRSKLLSRRSVSQLWFDPRDGAAVRRTQRDLGSRARLKSYRFDAHGVQAHRRTPANKEQADSGLEAWSERSQNFDPYPAEHLERARSLGSDARPVIEPGALLYLISALDPEVLESGFETLTFAKGELHWVEIRFRGVEPTEAHFVIDDQKSRDPERVVQALVYTVEPRPIGQGSASEFELLGLEGAVEIVIEPELRIPIQIRGRLPPVGKIVVRLESAAL